MAVPFYLPEGGADDTASSSAAGTSSSASSSFASSSSSSSAASSDGASSVASQSPNTTNSATQTPMQSPLVPGEQLMLAIYEAFQRYSINSASQVFQYPPPPSPSCSLHSPSYSGGDVFFPRGRSTPRTPRTSVSFAAGEEVNFFRQHPTTPQPMPPQSAPPMHHNYMHQQHQQQQQHLLQPQPHHQHYHHPAAAAYATTQYAQYTPPPTPTANSAAPAGSNIGNTASVGTSTGGFSAAASGLASTSSSSASSSSSAQCTMRLHRSHSDAARRSRLTSTGEDEREYQSEHETSWDEFDDRYDNFTAGRERLQEFNGRIPPRKKKNKEIVPKAKPEKKDTQSFTWPTVVTVFVVAMGCGFLVAR